MKFGAQLSSPCRVVDLEVDGPHLTAMLSDAPPIESRAVLIATECATKTLPLERWIDFEGAGSTTRQPSWKPARPAPDR